MRLPDDQILILGHVNLVQRQKQGVVLICVEVR